ncbi:major facilitator superfamily transporter [Rhizoctonia solani]|uniref:Major facilitator superfamily transporter n=1 Tax=Rhizoctonia solani TaxID=456999 RepID=A0A8H8PC85_9AGAM|nr:major facilitator superfamily transporter [Rhizoctonia solani]QRW27182.1 major facilitator superfamily transporter [Rhizoctonia solani]
MAISMPCSPSSDSTFSEPSSRASTPTLVPSQLGADDKFDDGRSITESLISSLASDTTDVERNSMCLSNDELSFERLLVIHASLAVCLFLAITDTTIVSTSLPRSMLNLVDFCTIFLGWRKLHVDTDDISTRIRTIHNDVRPQAGIIYVYGNVPEHILVMWCSSVASDDVMIASTCANDSRFRATDLVSWRWAFYMNLPVGCAALIAAMISLSAWHEAPCNKSSVGHLLGHFDWVGLWWYCGARHRIFIGYYTRLYVSSRMHRLFSSNRYAKGHTLTLALVFAGIASLTLGALYESGIFGATRCWGLSLGANPKHALFAPMLLRTRAAGIILVFSFFQTMAFNAGTFYLALYYQCTTCWNTIVTLYIGIIPCLVNWVLHLRKDQAHITIIRAGLGLMATGFGLMILLDERSSMIMQTLIPLVAGVGVGFLLKTPATALSLAMRGCDVPAVTAGLLLVRFIGTASGVSIGGAIYQSRLAVNLPSDFDLDMSVPNFDYRLLTTLQPEPLRNSVLQAVSRSISSIWVICALCLSIGFFLSLFLKQTPVDDTSSSNDETSPSEHSSMLQSQFDQKNYGSTGTCKKSGV